MCSPENTICSIIINMMYMYIYIFYLEEIYCENWFTRLNMPSIIWRTRKTSDAFSPSSKEGCRGWGTGTSPRIQRPKNQKHWYPKDRRQCPIPSKERIPLFSAFVVVVLFSLSVDWMIPTHNDEGGLSLLSLVIKMLIIPLQAPSHTQK